MKGPDHASDKVSLMTSMSNGGNPNKRWKAEYDNYLIPLLVEQARKRLKCDKSFKCVAFSYAAIAVNARFNTEFTTEDMENIIGH